MFNKRFEVLIGHRQIGEKRLSTMVCIDRIGCRTTDLLFKHQSHIYRIK